MGEGMSTFYSVVFFVFGLVLGSFFNVVGIRLPKGVPFGNDRSACPTCERQLTSFELIPLLSYIIQGGKCRGCKEKISIRYPLMELATGLLFLMAYIQLGFQWELVTAIILMSMLVIVFVTDIHYMLIPNKVLLFFLPFLIVMRLIVPLDPWYGMIIGGIAGYGVIALIIIMSKGGMGAGDMKLFGVLGIVLGWKLVLLTFFFAALFGAIIGIIMQRLNKAKKRQPIPFGPYIVIATVLVYFYGNEIIDWYMRFL